jgi:hypothetical protein
MFYTYRENNSGGEFYGPALYVIIEADSPEEANERAVAEAGLYFNGVADGIDCPCCGDRWAEKGSNCIGDSAPMLNGEREVSEESEPDELDRAYAKRAGGYIQIYRKQ